MYQTLKQSSENRKTKKKKFYRIGSRSFHELENSV